MLALVALLSFTAMPSSEIECLAKNIYWEGRSESLAGQTAIGLVTLNRVRDKHYPDTICGVVYDPAQFSWYWDGQSDKINDKEAYDIAYNIAITLTTYSQNLFDFTHGSIYYHADYVNPYWAKAVSHNITIGKHIFYGR